MSALTRFYASTVGKKIVVAVTGLMMMLFLVGHVLGNLLVFEGRGDTPHTTKLNEYGELLRVEPAILWVIRLVLLATVVAHFVTTVSLTRSNRAARGVGYAVQQRKRSTLASRTMIWGGILLAGFIVYHLLHFTAGVVHSAFYEHGDVYSNIVQSFQNPLIAGAYLLAMAFVFLHLQHGIASLAETLGVSHPRYLALFRKGGPVLAFLLVLGFSSIPIGVLVGIIK